MEAGRFRKFIPRGAPRVYRRLARRVVARPLLVLVLAVPPLLLLAVESARLTPQLPTRAWLPAAMESARGRADLEAMGRVGRR